MLVYLSDINRKYWSLNAKWQLNLQNLPLNRGAARQSCVQGSSLVTRSPSYPEDTLATL